VRSATTIENIYACFDDSAAAVVEACAAFYRGLGVQLHVDHGILSRGTDARTPWQRLIDSCDNVQLYWSSGAYVSPVVTQEWRYALSAPHRGTHFVRPVSWESPSPPIPRELQRLPASRLFLDLFAT
jgi:hypothetical protein